MSQEVEKYYILNLKNTYACTCTAYGTVRTAWYQVSYDIGIGIGIDIVSYCIVVIILT